MPQLMPLNWIFSILVSIFLLFCFINFFGNLNVEKMMNLKKDEKMMNKWFW